MYKILSISGGGVRGLIPARELSVLTTKELQEIDCFAGTSTGGILALGAAAGFTFSELETLYAKWIPTIFKARNWWDRVWKLDELRRANYDNVGLIKACQAVFGDMKMSDLICDVVVPSVCLDGFDRETGVRCAQTAWYTKTMAGASKIPVWEVAVKTASAPVYFPSYQGFVDGGLSMNNPAAKSAQIAWNSGIPLDQLCLLAVTTGAGPLYKENKRNDWGLVQWGPDIISLIMRVQEQTSLDLVKLHDLGFYAIADYALPHEVSLDSVKWAADFSTNSYAKSPASDKAINDFKALLHK